MARYSRRIFDGTAFDDLLGEFGGLIQQFTRLKFEFLTRTPPDVDDVPPRLPLSSGFTDKADIVMFDLVQPGQFTSSYYNALNGNDFVILPSDKAKADAIGYDPGKVFNGNGGNDTIIGQGLNDLINGGRHNDHVEGRAGADLLFGDYGNDQLFGGAGNDILAGGFGIDLVYGDDGDDIIYNVEEDDPPLPAGHDHVYGGAGNDDIAALDGDYVSGEDGDDTIWLFGTKEQFAQVEGGNGNDAIVGSAMGDFISTGVDLWLGLPSAWSAATKAQFGGFFDKVESGDGDDFVTTMPYCKAEVHTGNGDDEVFIVGTFDVVSTGAGKDTGHLFGGAGSLNLGDGDDTFIGSRPSYDNLLTSEVTLGAGADRVVLGNDEWSLYEENQQLIEEAPLVLDFDVNEDFIESILVTNVEDATLSLDPANVKTIYIPGGSALIYDAPVDLYDFCFARFNGVSAWELQVNIDQHTTFV